MRQYWRPVTMITVAVTGITLLFQNCSDPLGTNTNESSFSENLPFAYDATLDTIAYMSCSGGDSAADPQAIWTFKAGAYGANSGIRLRKSFVDMTKSFSANQKAAALAESLQNSNAVLQLAIRPASEYQTILTKGGSGSAGEDFSSLLGPLDEPQIATKLATLEPNSNQRLNYFSGISGLSGRKLEGGIRFTDDEGIAQDVRRYLVGSALLTATYTADHMPNNNARGPGGVPEKAVYGRGYKVQFNYPPGETVARAVASIRELDLETGRDPADTTGWSCPAELQLRISRNCDAECACSSDSGNMTHLQLIRRVLKVEHWYVNLAQKCAVQKTAFQQCYPTTAIAGSHYVSVCVRN